MGVITRFSCFARAKVCLIASMMGNEILETGQLGNRKDEGKQELYNQEMSHKTQSQRHIFGAPICMEFLKIFGGRPYRLAFWNGAHVAFVALWVA
jgi:hypothetical protein